jgi:hypothetical protein
MEQKADATLLVVSLDADLYERLLVVANREGLSTHDLVMLAIANYVRGVDDGKV